MNLKLFSIIIFFLIIIFSYLITIKYFLNFLNHSNDKTLFNLFGIKYFLNKLCFF